MDFPLPIMHLQSELSGLVSKPAEKSASVRAFMLHMYWSSAEPMTKEQLVCTGGLVSENAQCFFGLQWHQTKNLRVASKGALKKADEELKEELMQRLVDSKLLGAALQVSFNHDPARLPLRELPHGSWSELFLMYKSYAGVKNEPHACRATFFQVAQEWKQCLRFHKKTQHAQCATCAHLRSLLQNTTESQLQIASV